MSILPVEGDVRRQGPWHLPLLDRTLSKQIQGEEYANQRVNA